ncbi:MULTISPECIES: recombination regulator RecX [Glaesserella]|uniref:Regulatory protein RecX n=1 Tax=Glaesserella australis TaxID=2094024 RepID=A0A328BZC6_9PAST|nr:MULTISPECIES: recombination regulator RecX [Glaesserella]AUI66337.1 recombination regulator RecX [Glaesserella sp. 15-184]RAL19449.1 recombination regulator RecX [Glaesserella australis]
MKNKYSASSYLLYLLSKREYSEMELHHKLQLKEYELEEVEQAIIQAQTNGWQSDERFATSYVRYRSQQGYGPRRLKQELQQKGVKEWVISQALDESEIDFFELAERLFEKKRPRSWDLKAKQKMWRYMVSHGFYHDHFGHLLEIDYDEYDE